MPPMHDRWYPSRMSIAREVGQQIKAARKRSGMSQLALAEAVKMAQSNISRIEAGDIEASPTQITAIARVLGVPLSTIVREDSGTYSTRSAVRSVLSDYDSPGGLRDLVSDAQLLESLAVTDSEIQLLASVPLEGVTKDGYLQLLVTLRAIRP